jgi:EAL domain-containing protein (putative c-di-GMP-specific phosphodiesterase class I)
MFVSVNLSARQFSSPALGPLVEDLLAEFDIPAGALHLEITETAILKDAALVAPILSRWRSLGIQILLDDFGTGYSPLGHLMGFPVDSLKIDRSFIGTMDDSEESRHIVRAVISLARILHLSVVAEGAETESQMSALRDFDCEYVQGYYISRPLAPEDAERFLGRQ